uniref:TetR-like C-terminal domain-containing protein n=1 Tax=Candidatus Fimivicinus sp. TaxID=3056640 RepID=UPI003FED7E84
MQEETQDRRIKRTKMLLQNALVDLMLEKAVGKISVKELTQKADVNRSTFYLHYLDIYDMLEQMENEFVETIQGFFHDFFTPLPTSMPLTLFVNISEWLEQDKEYYLKLLRGSASGYIFEELESRIRDEFLTLLYLIFLDEESLDLRTRVNFTVSGTVGVLRMWVMEGGNISLVELSETIDDILNNGMIQDYPQKILMRYPDYMQRLETIRKEKELAKAQAKG